MLIESGKWWYEPSFKNVLMEDPKRTTNTLMITTGLETSAHLALYTAASFGPQPLACKSLAWRSANSTACVVSLKVEPFLPVASEH